jgi:hypothetical protein
MNFDFLKRALFEAYAAGFESGMMQNEDIVTAYEKWYERLIKDVSELLNEMDVNELLYDWK